MNTAQSTNGIALREPCTHQVGPVLWERSFDFTHLPLLQLLGKYHISASWCHQIPIKSIIATIWGHGSSTSWSCGGFGLHGMFVMSKTFSWTLAAGSSTYLCLTSTHSLSLPWSKQTGSHVTTAGMAVSLRDKRLRVWGRIGIKLCLPAKNTMHSCTFSLPAKNIKVYRMYEKKITSLHQLKLICIFIGFNKYLVERSLLDEPQHVALVKTYYIDFIIMRHWSVSCVCLQSDLFTSVFK